MKQRYTRLKLRLLAWVAGGAFLCAALCITLGCLVQETTLGAPLRAFAYGIGRTLFGRTNQEMDAFWAEVVLPNQAVLFAVILFLAMLVAFYLAMGRFTRWFAQISAAIHQMTTDSGTEIALDRELGPVEEDLNGMRRILASREAEASEAAQRARDLVVFLAHDLKTPLTSVLGYLNLLHDQPGLDPEQRAKYTGIALEKARRLEELINEFFDINRLELAQIDGAREVIRLSMLLEQVADEFWPLFEEKGLKFLPSISDGLAVRGDPDKLARVFDNVLRNAVNYSVPGGTVGLRAFRQGGEVTVSIRNEGLEIPEQELSHIFEKFYRLDAARSTRTGGAGLGLAIAKEIVERHGGRIRAESTGKRTVFTITLPAWQEMPGTAAAEGIL